MNVINDFPITHRVKVTHGENTIYEGIVACHLSQSDCPMVVIEQCNRQQIAFLFFETLKGQKGWALVPYPLPRNHCISQEVMLHNFQLVN